MGGATASSSSSGAGGCGDHLVISELRTAGPGGQEDEFVELFNPTGSNIAITNVTIETNGGTSWKRANLFIQARTHFVIAGASFDGKPDASLTGGLTNAGFVSLVSNGSAVDTICYCYGDDCSVPFAACADQGVPAQSPGWTKESLARSDACHDTDDSAADFAAGAPTPGT